MACVCVCVRAGGRIVRRNNACARTGLKRPIACHARSEQEHPTLLGMQPSPGRGQSGPRVLCALAFLRGCCIVHCSSDPSPAFHSVVSMWARGEIAMQRMLAIGVWVSHAVAWSAVRDSVYLSSRTCVYQVPAPFVARACDSACTVVIAAAKAHTVNAPALVGRVGAIGSATLLLAIFL